MDKTFFSIIIPTLNEEKYLPGLLSDFAGQKLKNFNVIIVDAESKDKTKEKALEFSKNLPLEFYSVKKESVSHQRNVGAQKAKGEYFVFLDADASVKPNFTENVYSHIVQKYQRKKQLLLPVMSTDKPSRKNKMLFKLINSVIEMSQSLNRPLAPGGSIIIRKELFKKLNGFDEKLYMSEDHDLVQRARKLGVKAKIMKNVKVVFSLRRIEKEGQAAVLYKYFLALLYMLINEKVTAKTFAYEMGGDKYIKSEKSRRTFVNEVARLKKLVEKTSVFLQDSLS